MKKTSRKKFSFPSIPGVSLARVGIALISALVVITLVAMALSSMRLRNELKDARAQIAAEKRLAERGDATVAEKIRTESAGDAKVGRITQSRRQEKTRDQSYREYLDAPLHPATLRLYKRASEISYAPTDGADRADADPGETDPAAP